MAPRLTSSDPFHDVSLTTSVSFAPGTQSTISVTLRSVSHALSIDDGILNWFVRYMRASSHRPTRSSSEASAHCHGPSLPNQEGRNAVLRVNASPGRTYP